MKFIFADAIDVIDPKYDFVSDRNAPGRKPYWDDQYPHEFLKTPPYDGILISRGIVGDFKFPGKYSASQQMRFRREGARKFLRLDREQFKHLSVFGDCGAFSYVKLEEPPYTAEEMMEFYADGQFTHGCSVDHVIFDFDVKLLGLDGGSTDARRRFDITLANAELFLKASKAVPGFTPMGVVQGWSPGSMAEAGARLEAMGYTYLALGGLVPLGAAAIHAVLRAVRQRVPNIQLHILGFAKAEHIHEFVQYKITSFDSTSPLIRAFKDARANYYTLSNNGGLNYYSAVRVPQALENSKLLRAVKTGKLKQERLVELEAAALTALRAYDRDSAGLEETVEAVMRYHRIYIGAEVEDEKKVEREVEATRERTTRTLAEKPWKSCSCEVCKQVSIDVVIFRSSNRNKRRGFHNLAVYAQHLKRTLPGNENGTAPKVLGRKGKAKCEA